MLARILRLTFIFILIATSAFAKPVTLDTAKKTGITYLKAKEQFFENKPYLAPESFTMGEKFSIFLSHELKDSNGKLLAYIFDLSPAGYIVISPDTDIQPVIAYSFKGRFPIESAPENILLDMVTWDMTYRLEALPVTTQKLIQENNILWEKYLKADESLMQKISQTEEWGPWIKTTWHQTEPYNKFCPLDPTIPTSRCVVGCVATSMAQIVFYWKYPLFVTFTDADDYTTGGKGIKIDDDYETLDFPSFSELNTKLTNITYTEDEDEIAALCFACGISVKMNYTSEGSWAWPSDTAFKDKFGYASADLKSNTGTSDFYDILEKNMKNAQPAQLSIYKTENESGHAIVSDGFNDNGEYHLNFGWGGSCDGWYFLPEGMPEDYTIVYNGILNISVSTKTRSVTAIRGKEMIITPNRDGYNDEVDFKEIIGDAESITIFNITGRKIKTIERVVGTEWDGSDEDEKVVESGVYIYQLKDGKKVISGIIIVAK